MPVSIVSIVIGAPLLILGRKLFWFFVGAVGFVVAFFLSTQYLHVQPAWLGLVIGLVVGVLGSLLAVFLQRVAIALAGFFAGGLAGMALSQMLGWDPGALVWVIFAVGGVIAAALAFVLFDWVLIILSAVIGAGMVVEGLTGLLDPAGFSKGAAAISFGVLALVGAVIQFAIWRGDKKRKERKEAKG